MKTLRRLDGPGFVTDRDWLAYACGDLCGEQVAGILGLSRRDYRVIYRISNDDRRIDVVAIEHRSDAYRPR